MVWLPSTNHSHSVSWLQHQRYWYWLELFVAWESHIWEIIFVLLDMEIWWMTLKNNRTPLLYYIKLCATLEIHGYIQLGATVWKHSIRVKLVIFCSAWPWTLTDDLKKQHDTSYTLPEALCIISNPSVKSNLSYNPETLNLDKIWWVFCPAWDRNLMDVLEKQQVTSSILH